MQARELPQKLNKRTFAERIVDTGMECKSRILFRQGSHPASLVQSEPVSLDISIFSHMHVCIITKKPTIDVHNGIAGFNSSDAKSFLKTVARTAAIS